MSKRVKAGIGTFRPPLGALATAVLMAVAFALGPMQSAFGVIRDGGIDPANLGQGGWLYRLNQATNNLWPNSIPAVTNENSLFLFLKNQGMDYVIVKAGIQVGATCTNYWDSPYSTTSPVFTSNLVNLAHANGLKIFGSNRSSAQDTNGEIWIASYVFNQGADGFIWDAEAEWEPPKSYIPDAATASSLAWTICSAVRANWPNKFLALNAQDTLYLHPIPWKEFGYWSDCMMPMVYHHAASQGNAIMAMHWMDVNYTTWQRSLTNTSSVVNGQTIYWTNSIKPIVPMRDVYGANSAPAGVSPASPLDVMAFIDYTVADPNYAPSGAYLGTDYFRSELHDLNQYAYMQAATLGNFPGVVNNIVMDDARASKSGSWTMVKTMDASTGSTVTFGTGGDTNSFGTNYFSRNLTGSGAYMQWTPTIVKAGDYNVFQWHPSTNSASTTVPFVINYNGGSTTVYANQQTNAGNWSLLGRFNFAAGASGYIRVTDSINDSTKLALVDGVKLVYATTTTSLGSSANPSVYGNSVTLTATVAVNAGGPPTGTVTFKDSGVALGTVDLDGAGQATFTTNKLAASGSPRSLTAVYSGDSNFSGSTSSPLMQTVNQIALTVSGVSAYDKIYDRTMTAMLNTGGASLVGVINGDNVTLNTGNATGAFADKTVGTNKTVTVSGLSTGGADAGNYTLTPPATTASITARGLTVSGITANDKVYDGTTAATLMGTPSLSGVLGSDAVSLTGTAAGAFADANVGTNKTVNISGLGLTGGDAGNYSLTVPPATASITGAGTTTGVVSSENPSGPGTNLTFTATVGSTAGTPVGDVIFRSGGVAFSTNSLVGGVAAATTASLPLGTNHVQAEYAGGGNFLGSSGALDQVVKVFVTCSGTNELLSVVKNTENTFTLTFVGTPQAEYYVVTSPDLTVPMSSWLPLTGSTNTVTNANGLWQFTVTNSAPQLFYRSTAVAPCP